MSYTLILIAVKNVIGRIARGGLQSTSITQRDR
jgi:hypothetical protein